jgi:hypothetical protein
MNAALAWLKSRPLWQRVMLVVFICLFFLGLGGGLVRWLVPREKVVDKTHETIVTHTEWKAQVVTVAGATVYKDRVITKKVFAPDGGLASETTEHDKTSDQTATTTTTEQSGKASEQATITTSHTATPTADRFLASVGYGVSPLQGAAGTALLELDARIIGPLHGGAWFTVPVAAPQQFTVGLKLGVSFGN